MLPVEQRDTSLWLWVGRFDLPFLLQAPFLKGLGEGATPLRGEGLDGPDTTPPGNGLFGSERSALLSGLPEVEG